MLLHELAHIHRWDWLTQMTAHVACAMYWFNPLAWLAARQMRLEREQACDDVVLAAGSAPGEYAEELLQIAASLRGTRLIAFATVPMARHLALEVRLQGILDCTRRRAALNRTMVLGTAAALGLVALPLAMMHGAGRHPGDSALAAPSAPKPMVALPEPSPKGAVELLALTYNPSTNQPWWLPDGSPTDNFSFRYDQHFTLKAAGQVYVSYEAYFRAPDIAADATWGGGPIGCSGGPRRKPGSVFRRRETRLAGDQSCRGHSSSVNRVR